MQKQINCSLKMNQFIKQHKINYLLLLLLFFALKKSRPYILSKKRLFLLHNIITKFN